LFCFVVKSFVILCRLLVLFSLQLSLDFTLDLDRVHEF